MASKWIENEARVLELETQAFSLECCMGGDGRALEVVLKCTSILVPVVPIEGTELIFRPSANFL